MASGWVPSEPPAAEHANWLQNTTSAWLKYLDEQGTGTVLASSLDFSTRLVGGGQWSLAGTTLSWNAGFNLAIPSANDADNAVAAGSIALPAGSVGYVVANMPFSTTATTTSGSAQLTGVLYGDVAKVGQLATGAGIPANTSVQTVSSDGQTITLSAAATASASGVTVTFRGTGVLTPQVAATASLVPGPNTVVFARGLPTTAIVGVGSGQMLLRQGESKQLLGHGFSSSFSAVAGAALPANAPVYVSPGTADVNRTLGAVYAVDASGTGNLTRAQFAGFTSAAAAAGATVEVVSSGRLNGFSSLTPGAMYYASNTSGAVTATRSSATAGFIVPVGVALSATQMFVAAGQRAQATQEAVAATTLSVSGAALMSTIAASGNVSAPNVISSSGFKSVVSMGQFVGTSQAGQGSGQAQWTYFPVLLRCS